LVVTKLIAGGVFLAGGHAVNFVVVHAIVVSLALVITGHIPVFIVVHVITSPFIRAGTFRINTSDAHVAVVLVVTELITGLVFIAGGHAVNFVVVHTVIVAVATILLVAVDIGIEHFSQIFTVTFVILTIDGDLSPAAVFAKAFGFIAVTCSHTLDCDVFHAVTFRGYFTLVLSNNGTELFFELIAVTLVDFIVDGDFSSAGIGGFVATEHSPAVAGSHTFNHDEFHAVFFEFFAPVGVVLAVVELLSKVLAITFVICTINSDVTVAGYFVFATVTGLKRAGRNAFNLEELHAVALLVHNFFSAPLIVVLFILVNFGVIELLSELFASTVVICTIDSDRSVARNFVLSTVTGLSCAGSHAFDLDESHAVVFVVHNFLSAPFIKVLFFLIDFGVVKLLSEILAFTFVICTINRDPSVARYFVFSTPAGLA
jgi:hypothetical protein